MLLRARREVVLYGAGGIRVFAASSFIFVIISVGCRAIGRAVLCVPRGGILAGGDTDSSARAAHVIVCADPDGDTVLGSCSRSA